MTIHGVLALLSGDDGVGTGCLVFSLVFFFVCVLQIGGNKYFETAFLGGPKLWCDNKFKIGDLVCCPAV